MHSTKIKIILLFLLLAIAPTVFVGSQVQAQTIGPPPYGCPGGPIGPGRPSECPYTQAEVDRFCDDSSNIPTGGKVYCSDGKGGVVLVNGPVDLSADCEERPITKDNCGIIGYLQTFINLLSAVVGIVIAIMFAVRGMQYMTARDNAQQVTQAKEQFFWLVISLVVYLFSFAILQWLVPGGIF